MALPWTRPGPPIQADEDLQVLYAAIGQSLSSWEQIESELSHWYALFIGKMWQHEAYDEFHEKGRTGQARITTVEKAGEVYFVSKPDQKVEGEFATLIRATRALSDRRHELAHGIARPVQFIWPIVKETMTPPKGKDDEYVLVPPHYQRDWFDKRKWNPEFVYTSKEIYEIDNSFGEHLHLLIHFRYDYLPNLPKPSF